MTSLQDSAAAEDAVPIVECTMAREAETLLALDLVGLTAGVTVPTLLMVGDRSSRVGGDRHLPTAR